MSETVEQIKQRAAELQRRKSRLTTEHIDALNETAWELRHYDTPLMTKLSGEALELALRCDYARGRAFALRAAGWRELRAEQYQRAAQTLTESCATFAAQRSPEKVGLITTINTLAVTQKYLGNHEAALASCANALELCEESGERDQAAYVNYVMATIHTRLSDYATTIGYYYQASPVFEQSSVSWSQAAICVGISELFVRIGEAELAIEHAEHAIAYLQKHQDRYPEAVAWVNVGAAQHSQKKYQQASDSYWHALQLSQEANRFEVQVEAQRSLGSLQLERGDVQSALAHLEQALELARRVNDFYEESQTLLQLGLAHKRLGDEAKSLQACEQALAISERYGYNEVRARIHLALSELFEQQGKLAAALAHHQAFHQFSQAVYGTSAARQIERLLLENRARGSRKAAHSLKQLLTRQRHTAAAHNYSAAHQQPRLRSALPPHKLQQIRQFVNEHLDQNITLAMLADAVRLNRDHFIRSFKQATEKTPHQFVLEQRVERAKRLLRTTSLPLAEIALRCGFNSQAHLTTQFRLSTGATPHQYRQSA